MAKTSAARMVATVPRYRRRVLTMVVLLGVTSAIHAAEPPSPEPLVRPRPSMQSVATSTSAPTAVRQMIEEYCVTCHNERMRVGGLVLESADPGRIGENAVLWEKVLAKLVARAMPPVGVRRPDDDTYERTIGALETELDRAAAEHPNPGRKAPFHRLNRVEYGNAIRDLLGLDVDSRALLPADDGSFGFDNIASALTVSSARLERYMTAATKIARLAVGDPTLKPAVQTYTLPTFELLQGDRMDEDMPFGSRGGVAVHHFFPLDGEYILRVRLERQTLGSGPWLSVRGLDEENPIDVWFDGELVKRFRMAPRETTLGENPYRDEEVRDQHLEFRFAARAGTHLVAVTFPKRTWYMENVGVSRLPVRSSSYGGGVVSSRDHGKIEMALDQMEITGPLNGMTPADSLSRRRLFVCRPLATVPEEQCARSILGTLARRAYRRPVTAADVDSLMAFYREGRGGGSFDRGIQAALERVLADPEFLFRIETDPPGVKPGVPYRVTDVQLASRLSFFLWSSIPDDELLDLAASGALRQPRMLEQQVKRMLADPRAHALVDNFFGQWLYVRNMASHMPDAKFFPQFDESLREAFQKETELFFQHQLETDRSVFELLDANYTFVNERLARHYGIPGVYGSHYRRVSYPDSRRGGLLGHGSILTVTSYPDRTSPVVRGKWVLENILGAPPPPPPPEVPALPTEGADGKPQSMRGRLERHRQNPVCAACHSRMDPLGFALENFDAVGRWRRTDAGSPIDASGSLTDGTKFDSPATFRRALRQRREEVLATVTQKLMTYALGRGLESYDMPAVRRVTEAAEEQGARWSAIITAIASSHPFVMRMPAEPTTMTQ